MSWINFFENKVEKNYSFGRGTNADISPDEEELYEKCYNAFEEKNNLDGYEFFLQSLQNYTDSNNNKNVIIQRKDETLNFEIFQGTSKIIGNITEKTFYAEVILIKKVDASVALKRYILERNYQLTYAYYFTDSQYIKLKIFHNNIMMSPQKVFFPIRELALNSDFDKDYIRSEFPQTPLQNTEHLKPLEQFEIDLKFKYLKKWINDVEKKIPTLPLNDATGMQAFLYLNLLFKIDYLLVPKYDIYHKISQKVQEYFSDENMTIEAKNEEIKQYILLLRDMEFEEFASNFYNAKYTFNPTEKTAFEDIVNFINESQIKVRWYKNNRHNQIIPTLYQYIALYSLYNYGLNQVLRGLFHLIIKIQNPSFFQELDSKLLYDTENKSFAKRAIINTIENIISPHQTRYKSLQPFGDKLNFSSLNEFCNSFYTQLKHLNFEEI